MAYRRRRASDRERDLSPSCLEAAPSVEGVIGEQPFVEQAVVISLDFEASDSDGEQPGPEWVGIEVFWDVGGVNDPGQPRQGRVLTESELVDEDLEGALAFPVSELGAWGVKERPSSSAAVARTRSEAMKTISASGSMNRRISHGHAIRSVLGRARVIHFIRWSPS